MESFLYIVVFRELPVEWKSSTIHKKCVLDFTNGGIKSVKTRTTGLKSEKNMNREVVNKYNKMLNLERKDASTFLGHCCRLCGDPSLAGDFVVTCLLNITCADHRYHVPGTPLLLSLITLRYHRERIFQLKTSKSS